MNTTLKASGTWTCPRWSPNQGINPVQQGLTSVNRRKISTNPADQKTAVHIATRHNIDVIYFHRYLTAVKSQLQGLCQVQHAPFAKASGAVDSRYGLECLSLILSTTSLEPTSYDAIVFNFGMHDIDYSKVFPEVRDRSRSCYVVVVMNVINAFSLLSLFYYPCK